MSTRIVILGAGPGGYVAAVRAAQNGARVTVIEMERVGGTCLNWGCIPSKIMKTAAEMMENFHRAETFGIRAEQAPSVDMPALMARKAKILQTQAKGIESLLAHHNITLVAGKGCIEARGLVTVRQADGQMTEVPWDRLIISTGTVPLNIPAFPFDGRHVISSNEALCLDAVPDSVVIVGGGVIGCEFACILSALGSKVTVVEALDRLLPLPAVDESCSKILMREMKKRKIKFMVNRTVTAVGKEKSGLSITIGPSPFAEDLKARDKQALTVKAQKVLVCIGRSPNTTGIGLETIGVATDDRGWIEVDESMQTSAADVYAIGDVLGPDKIMLAHVASTEGLVAADNATGAKRQMDYAAVPGAIFTMPEVATVGITEAQAVQQGIDARSDSVLFRTLGKAQAIGELAGQAKVVSDAGSGKILGVHLIGPHATDLIAEGTLAVRTGRTTHELADTIHAHPTLAEAMLEVSLKAVDKALHG
jgi:dihydrolipoamide dehydrogenase